MEWSTLISVGGPLLALLVGGLIGRRKTRAETHSILVGDAVVMATRANERTEQTSSRLDLALKRIDELEDAERRRDELARAHLRWDWQQIRKLTDLGHEVPDPPPLFWYDTGK